MITGTLSDGQIIVAAGDTDKIQIVLNGVTINCDDSAPIYIKSADKVFVTLNQNNTVNTLNDSAEYIQTDDNMVDAVIFSKADLTINGEGTTMVSGPTGNGDGALDYNGTADITGGILVVAGSTEMAQGFSDISTQCSLFYNLTSSCEAGTEI